MRPATSPGSGRLTPTIPAPSPTPWPRGPTPNGASHSPTHMADRSHTDAPAPDHHRGSTGVNSPPDHHPVHRKPVPTTDRRTVPRTDRRTVRVTDRGRARPASLRPAYPDKTWTFRLTLLAGGSCDHARETAAYRPSPRAAPPGGDPACHLHLSRLPTPRNALRRRPHRGLPPRRPNLSVQSRANVQPITTHLISAAQSSTRQRRTGQGRASSPGPCRVLIGGIRVEGSRCDRAGYPS